MVGLIKPSHLLYRCGDICYLESYVPSRFARQFEYDQLYVNNLNLCLEHIGSLIDGARAWKYFIIECTRAHFCMPLRLSKLWTSMGFCRWYAIAHSTMAEFKINTLGLKLINARLKKKVVAREQRKPVRVARLKEFELEDEASMQGVP